MGAFRESSSREAIDPFEISCNQTSPFMRLEELWSNRAVPKSGRKTVRYLLHPFFSTRLREMSSQSSGCGA